MLISTKERIQLFRRILFIFIYLSICFGNVRQAVAEEKIVSEKESVITGSEIREEDIEYIEIEANPNSYLDDVPGHVQENAPDNISNKTLNNTSNIQSGNMPNDKANNKSDSTSNSESGSKSDSQSNNTLNIKSKSTPNDRTNNKFINNSTNNSNKQSSTISNSKTNNPPTNKSNSKNSISENAVSNNTVSNNTVSNNTVSNNSVSVKSNFSNSLQEIEILNNVNSNKYKNTNKYTNDLKERSDLALGSIVIYGTVILLGFFICKLKGDKMRSKKSFLIKRVSTKLSTIISTIVSTFVVTFIICGMLSGVNLQVLAAETQESTMTVSINDIEDTGEITEDEQSLYELDPLTVAEEKLNHLLCNTEWVDISVWLNSLTEDVRKQLLERDTILIQPTTIVEYEVDEEGTMTQSGETKNQLFYEYAFSVKPQMQRAVYFANKSGYYQYQFVKQNQVCTFTVKLSGIDTTRPTGEQQKITVSISQAGQNFVNFTSKAGNFNTTDGYETVKLQRAFESTTGGFYNTHFGFTFIKPKGYAGGVKYINKTSGRGDIFFYDAGQYATNQRTYTDINYQSDVFESVIACTNILKNTSVGSSNATGSAMIYQIVFTPAGFTTHYNGNGATSGSVASQSCLYDNTYTIPSNGFSRQYVVTYNGNGGMTEQNSSTAVYQFAGWGFQNSANVTHQPGQTYSNYTTSHQGQGIFYAIWKPGNVILPEAFRTGYHLKGWNTDRNAKNGMSASTSFLPTGNTLLYAVWEPNMYTVQYFDGISKAVKGSQQMTYDTEKELLYTLSLNLARQGYVFKGWKDAKGNSYTDGQKVLNLSEKSGDVVSMTAEWEARKDTPYRIEHYLQTSLSGGYELKDIEQMKGVTDTKVTPKVKVYSGYVSPGLQTVQIAADGSTVIKYYYKMVQNDNMNQNSNSSKQNGTENGSKSENDSSNESNSDKQKLGVRYYTDAQGNCYEITLNSDKTLTIRSVTSQTGELLNIDSSMTVDNIKYQVKEIAPYAFKNNQSIQRVVIGAGVTKIGKGAFEGCTNLKYVKFGNGLSIVESRAFYGCTSLETVKTNKNLSKIGSKAFYNCKKLKSYTIGKYVKNIGTYAFYNCKTLKKITISESVKVIGKKAFYGCSKLKKVPIKSTKLTKVGKAAFKKCNKKLKFTVPAKKKEAYTKLLKGKM